MNADGAGPPDRELDDLIVQHLDGGLDAAGQRRLAALLAASADARRTLAGYLRQEGATLRLASAGLLGAGGRDAAEDMRSGAVADATRARPAPHHPVAADAGRPAANWSRPAFALILGVRPNSPHTTINTSFSMPRSSRSLTSASSA